MGKEDIIYIGDGVYFNVLTKEIYCSDGEVEWNHIDLFDIDTDRFIEALKK